MGRLTRILCVVALAVAVGVPQRASAGRIGGPASESGVVAGQDAVYLEVPFEVGQAVVTVTWQGQRFIELRVYDADGNVTAGAGVLGRRQAVLGVYRRGVFLIEVRNTGNIPAEVRISTN